MAERKEIVEVAGREVAVSNPGKVYFPHTGHTKLDLVRYYLSVADGALRGVTGRPVVLKRFVNGAEGEAFFQKRAPESRPPGWTRWSCGSRPAGPRWRWCRTTRPRWPGWPISAASTSTRTRCGPMTWTIRMSCGWTWTRSRAWTGRRSARWPWSPGTCWPISG